MRANVILLQLEFLTYLSNIFLLILILFDVQFIKGFLRFVILQQCSTQLFSQVTDLQIFCWPSPSSGPVILIIKLMDQLGRWIISLYHNRGFYISHRNTSFHISLTIHYKLSPVSELQLYLIYIKILHKPRNEKYFSGFQKVVICIWALG